MPILKPLITQSFYTVAQTPQVKASIAEIKAAYGSIISHVSALTKVPERILAGFIFVESAGNPLALNRGSGAAGLMQLVPSSASDIIFLEGKSKRMQAPEKELLRKHLGTRLDCITSMDHMGHRQKCNAYKGSSVTRADLMKPEFNILVGAIYLGVLIDQFTENGVIRMDKVVTKYNRGMFAKIKGNTVAEVYAASPAETKNYIKKVCGANNAIQLAG